MWFKGTLLLSYTALLVIPTNAAFRTQVEDLVYSEQRRSPAPEQPVIVQHLPRAEAWSNATTSAPTSQESDPAAPDPAVTPIVVTTDDIPSTSSAQPRETSSDQQSSSAVVTEAPSSSFTATTSPPRSNLEPEKSSSVTPAASSTSEAEQLSSSSLAPSVLTPTTSPSPTTERQIPSSDAIESSAGSSTPIPSSSQASTSGEKSMENTPKSTSTIATSAASPIDTEPQPTSVQVSESSATDLASITDDIVNLPTSIPPASITPDVPPPPPSTTAESNTAEIPENTPSPPVTPSDVPPASPTPISTVALSSAAESISFEFPENTPTPSAIPSNAPPASDTPIPTPGLSSVELSTSTELRENNPSPTPSSVDRTGDQSTTANVEPPVTTDRPAIPSTSEPVGVTDLPVSTQDAENSLGSSTTPSPTVQVDATITPSGIFQFPSVISSLVSDVASNVGSATSSPLGVSITTLPVAVPTESLGDQLSSIFSEIENGASSIGGDLSSLFSEILTPSPSSQPTGFPTPTSEGSPLISSATNDLSQSTLSLSQSTLDTSGIPISASGTGASITSEASITGSAVSEVSSLATDSITFETTTNSLGLSLGTTDTSLQPTPSGSDASSQSTGQAVTTTPVTDLPSTTPATTLLPSPGSTGFSGSTNASLASSSFDISVTSVPTNTLSSISVSGSETVIDSQETSEAQSNSGSSTFGSGLPTATSASNSEVTGTGLVSSTGSDVATSTGASNLSNASTASRSGASASASNSESTLSFGASTRATGSAAASKSDSSAPTLQATMTMPSGFLLTTTGYIASVTTPAPATSSTKAAGSGDDAKPAPLTKSQTAGIAIGGTTCLLIALVAAVFLARRMHVNAANRKSIERVYPEIAYLYDPPTGGNDDAEAGGAVPTMSGGATGYGAVPVSSPRNSMSLNANPFREPIIPSPLPSPRLSGYGGPMGDQRGQYAKLEVNPYAFNPVFSEFPPLSPYGARSTQNLLPVPGSSSDPYAEPLEHDLLLNVRSDTPDSYVMLVPPSTPRTGGRLTPENGRYTPDNISLARTTPELTSSHSLAPSSQTNLSMMGAITPPQRAASPPPVHKGWDDIKLDIDGYDMTPSQRGVSPQPAHKGWTDIRLDIEEQPVLMPAPLTLAPAPKKNLPQRRQPPLAGAGQLLLSGQGLPLTIKPTLARPGTPGSAKMDRGLGLEVPNMTAVYGSPGPRMDEYSLDPTVRKKRSGELEFADPQLIGRSF